MIYNTVSLIFLSVIWISCLTSIFAIPQDPPPKMQSAYIGPCGNCTFQDEICYKPHPTDCEKFVQCYFADTNKVKAAYRRCPFGRYWDQSNLMCRDSKEVECKKDRCALKDAPMNYPLSTNGGCRAHWICEFKKSTQLCCEENYRYIAFKGCVPDKTCKDKCPQTENGIGKCSRMPISGDPTRYKEFLSGTGWHEMECPPSSHFNAIKCECDYHIGYDEVCRPKVFIPFRNNTKDYSGNNVKVISKNIQFVNNGQMAYLNGKAYLEIPDFGSWDFKEIVIGIKFLQWKPKNQMMGIISTGSFKRSSSIPSLMILKSGNSAHFVARTGSKNTAAFHGMMRNDWNTLYYMHDRQNLEGRINEVGLLKWSIGKLEIKHDDSLIIGYARGFFPFEGYIDEIAVYLCRPSTQAVV